MTIASFFEPRWLGLVNLAGVLVALLLWLLLDDERRYPVRAAFGVCGLALLLGRVGGVVSTTLGLVNQVTLREGDGLQHRWLDVALLVLGASLGVFVASLGTDAAPDADEVAAAPVAPAAPAVTLRGAATDVLDDGTADRASRLGTLLGDGITMPAPLVSRPGAVPLFAVAVALALPFRGFTRIAPAFGYVFFSRAAHAPDVVAHALSGLVVGLALLGAVIALGAWERWLVAAAFGLVAVGAGAAVAFPRGLMVEPLAFGGTALAAGLVLAATLRTAVRLAPPRRTALVAGVGAALLLFAATSYATTRASEQRTRQPRLTNFR